MRAQARDVQAAVAYRADDREAMQTARAALTAELSRVEERLVELRLRDAEPLRHALGEASPCEARYEEMPGEGRVRRCGACGARVADCAGLDEEAARALLGASGRPAQGWRARADGTFVDGDCPVGRRRAGRRELYDAARGVALCLGIVALVSGPWLLYAQLSDGGAPARRAREARAGASTILAAAEQFRDELGEGACPSVETLISEHRLHPSATSLRDERGRRMRIECDDEGGLAVVSAGADGTFGAVTDDETLSSSGR